MGLTAVLNDTPEKKRSRDKLLVLFSSSSSEISPNMWADNGFATIMLHAQIAIGDDARLAQICSTDDWKVTAEEVDSWACGMDNQMPDLDRQAFIAGLINAELLRIEAAVNHD